MAQASPARSVALRLLARQRRRGARARDLLRSAHEMNSLGSKGRALATRLVLGVNGASGELDRRINAHVTRPASVEPRVRDALRLASFEVLYLDTPRQVVVSQGVELVRSVQPRAARMANAVLRRVAEGRPEVDEAREAVAAVGAGTRRSVTARELAVASGYPTWLCERLLADVGAEGTARMYACALEPAPVYVARGPRAGEGVLPGRLAELGLDPVESGWPESWRLASPAALAQSGLVGSCEVVTADLAAQLVCRVAAVPAGRVLEVGQGRGTKSVLLAGLARELRDAGCASGAGAHAEAGACAGAVAGALHISGCDLIPSKVELSRKRMEVAGLSRAVSCTALDATRLGCAEGLPSELAGVFDVVLVDAPCSGTGTMRRHPEIPWALERVAVDPKAEGSLPALQLAMLKAASARVCEGGALVYATCSVLVAENEGVVEAFLASPEGAGFRRASVLEAPGVQVLGAEARELVACCVTETGAFQSVPCAGSHDGHFCCRLVRMGA